MGAAGAGLSVLATRRGTANPTNKPTSRHTSSELIWMGGYELAAKIRARQVSPVEAVEAVLARLEAVNPKLNAFVTVIAEEARAKAKQAESILMSRHGGALPPLLGVPITVKDLVDTANVRTTYGSLRFKDNVPAKDGVSWSRLKAAGAILIGKTTTPEFGALGVCDSPLTGRTTNPWREGYEPGGSSGGAGASVASGVAPLAWGSDGGGSIRIPASCCGVVGLKASRGRFPVAAIEAWDTVSTEGPLTRTVVDSALMLGIAYGPTPIDPLSLPRTGEDFVRIVTDNPSLAGKRIAFAPAPANANIDREVARVVKRAVEVISSDARAHVDEIKLDLPDPIQYFEDYWLPQYSIYGDIFDHPLTNQMLEISKSKTLAQYLTAANITRRKITEIYNDVFSRYDLIVTPTMPITAFPHAPTLIGGPPTINGISSKYPDYEIHRLTDQPSQAGLPAITIPCGFSTAGLPVGLQIIGPFLDDGAVLNAAAAVEKILPWAARHPPV